MTALHVLGRELRALSRLPQTYAIAVAYLIISGIFFLNILISTEVADLAQYYSNISSTLIVLVPVVAMRSFAEERRSGSLDLALSWPLSRTGLVLGKFVANTALVWALVSVVWLYFRLVDGLASIQMSRTAGGYVGLLLMAMAFSALALAVSARSSSPTAAAFLGFGLLLFLSILQYAPGWIGDSLGSLGPAAHFEPFPRGVLYLEDVAYFVVVTIVGLGFAVSALNRERPGRKLGSLVRRSSALATVIVIWAGGSALASEAEGMIDLTPARDNTVTSVTRRVLRAVDAPIRLTGFARPFSPEAAELHDLARQYEAAGADVVVEIFDPDVQPAKARDVGVDLYGQVLVKVGDRQEVIDGPRQGALTSALFRLGVGEPPRVCFTIGHGERSITDEGRGGASTLAKELRALFYEVKPVALAVSGAEQQLAQCAVVVVAGPRVEFLPEEMALLVKYTEEHGRLVVMADGGQGPRDQLNGLLTPWGLSIGSAVVSDLSSLAGDPAAVVTADYPSRSPATAQLREQELPVVLVSSVPVEPGAVFGEKGHFTALAKSSPKSWIASPPDGRPGLEGPFVLAALADHGELAGPEENPAVIRTRIGLVGSVEVAANRGIDLLGNRTFVTALIQWVERKDDLVAAGRPPREFYKLVLTETQKDRLVRQGIVLPAGLVLLPLPLVLLRLRRG